MEEKLSMEHMIEHWHIRNITPTEKNPEDAHWHIHFFIDEIPARMKLAQEAKGQWSPVSVWHLHEHGEFKHCNLCGGINKGGICYYFQREALQALYHYLFNQPEIRIKALLHGLLTQKKS